MYEMQKGKMLDKLPTKIDFDSTMYLVSTKYDGNRIFIVKKHGAISCFTSDWKQFDFPGNMLNELLDNPLDFVLEAEFNNNSIGKLGDRVHSAILTTFRTNFSKGLNSSTPLGQCQIKVFDCILIASDKQVLQFSIPYKERLANAKTLKLPDCMSVITTTLVTGIEAKVLAKVLVNDGWEGLMCVEPDSLYTPGKRGNHIVKLKYRKTADLLCIGVEPGEGKYKGMIGALTLKDSEGRVVSVGSGLNDTDRVLSNKYIGRIIEIEYEQILDTYIQPTFVCVRYDKQLSD
jgi:DNA ligase-1